MALHLISYQKNDRLFFEQEVAHHIVRSLRKQPGDLIHATDGKGTIFKAVLESGNDKTMEATILSQDFQIKKWKIHVACSLIKMESRFEYFLEKATETGIHQITPLICERTFKPKLRIQRAQKIINSAVQQSFNPYVPILDKPILLEEYLSRSIADDHNRYIATAIDRGEVPLLEQQYQGENPVHILIGPEGDFTPAEVDASIKQGWIPVSLGDNRLRTETAATMVVQIIKSCYHIKTQTTK